MGRGQGQFSAETASILYGLTIARGSKADARKLIPKDWWPDQIDYSAFCKFGASYFQDQLGMSGWSFWGVRSQSLPEQLRNQLKHNDTSPQVDQFLEKIMKMSYITEELGKVSIEKVGSVEWILSFENQPGYQRRADVNVMAAIEQISGAEGTWAWKDREGLRYLLYVDDCGAESQLLGYHVSTSTADQTS